MRLKKTLKKLNPVKRIRVKNDDLHIGEIVYTPLFGIWRHYGIVIQECAAGNHTIRTVHWKEKEPLNQTLKEFSAGKQVYREKAYTGSQNPDFAQAALEERNFKYNLFLNNCENFVRRAHKKKDVSLQVITGIGVVATTLALAILKKRLPRI